MRISFYLKNIIRRFRTFFFSSLNGYSPVLATKLCHFLQTGKWPNLINPRNFNEKLQWIKLHEPLYLKAECSDKYKVFAYISRKYDKKILNNLLFVYSSVKEVDWDALPQKFAIKCTHGCGYNIITNNKSDLDRERCLRKLDMWMGEKYGKRFLEYHYDEIEPRIIVEEYIETIDGAPPKDYKIYCFNGEAKLVLVCSGRERRLRLDFFDLSWRRLNIGLKKNESTVPVARPACFDEMIRHAEALSKPFTFVRMDFYDRDGEPVLGEFTFTPAANMARYYNSYGLKYLGELLRIHETGGSNTC